MSLMLRSILQISLFTLILAATAPAQTPTALRESASKAFDSGNYKAAIEAAQQFLQKFPDDANAERIRLLLGLAQYSAGDYRGCVETFSDPKKLPPEFVETANFHLGASLYQLGEFDKALTPLNSAAAAKDEEAKKTIAPFAQFYIGRSHMDKAARQQEAKDQAAAKKSLEAAITAFNKFMTDFPDHDLQLDVLTARATAYVLSDRLDDALKDLEALKAKPDSAEIIDDIDYLTGFVLTQSAQKLQADFKEEEARAVIAQAREIYQRLAKSKNLVLANQAAFQLANLDFASRNYQQAVSAYRNLRSRADLVQSQQERIESVRRQISQAAGNATRVRALQQTLKREEQKLAAVQNSPELAIDGLIRIGDCFLQLGSTNPIYYDMARLTYRFASKFADEDQKKNLSIQIIVSYALQGLAAKAEEEYTVFRKNFPNDPLAENVPFLIGQALQRQGKHQEAIQKFNESLQKFPGARITSQIPKEIAASQVALGKPDEAIKTFDSFIADAKAGKIRVAPEAIEDAQRQRALALMAAKKTDEAITAMKQLAETAKNDTLREEAAFQTAIMLSQAGKNTEAHQAFQKYTSAFPNSPRAPQAAWFSAVSLEKAKQFDQAMTTYREIAGKFKDTEIAINAMDKIWRLLLAQNKADEAFAAQDQFLAAYPQSPQAVLALYERAKFLDEKAKKKEEAAAAYQKVYDAFRQLPPAVRQSAQGEKIAEFPGVSLVRAGEILRRDAANLGVFKDLDDSKKAQWKSQLDQAKSLLEKSIREFPTSNSLAFALSKLVEVLLMQINAEQLSLNDAATYLSRLAGEMRAESTQIQIFIARASLMFQAGQTEQALLFYEEAFQKITDPKKMTWQDYDRFGSILLENQRWEKAKQVYSQLREHFQEPRAQAAATFGLGAVAQGMNELPTAEKFFAELKEKYPWSEKILEADYGRAMALLAQGKYEEAFTILDGVMGTTRSTNETKAKSMLAIARGLIEMGDKGLKTSRTKQGPDRPELNIYELAHNNAIKIDIFYRAALPQLVAEALYVAAEAKFKQARSESDPKRKAEATEAAKKLVDSLLREHPNSPWARKARDLT